MHELAFADAARPTPVEVLRLPLMPYTLGHECLLLQRRNPIRVFPPEMFAELDYETQAAAVQEAAWICAGTWRQNTTPDWLHPLKVALWRRRIRREIYALAIARFRDYFKAGTSLPPSPDPEAAMIADGKTERDASGREFGSPFLAQVYNFVSTRIPSGTEPWDVPYAFAAWLYFSNLESKGSYHIENRREAEVREELAEVKAKFAKEQAERKAKEEQCQA